MPTIVCSTPDSIAFFGLASLKGRVGLECKGLKGRGESAVKQAKRIYNLPKSTSAQEVLAYLEDRVNQAIAAKQAGNILSGGHGAL